MISDMTVPAHIIRLYAWEILRDKDVLSLINGKVPLIPLEDQPEVSDAGANYIIYGYSEGDLGNSDLIRQGVVAFRVIARNSNELAEITSILSRAFENSDIATEGVNIFSSNFANDALVGIRFTHIKASYIESADPAVTESGPVQGTVAIAYQCVKNLPTPVPESVTGGMWV